MSWIEDLVKPEMRTWEDLYRNRYSHDKTVRSTHGVNCTGGCSWEVFVKNGIITWEMQAIDYPRLELDIPDYEPRGCQRGICFSWYVYSPVRIKQPYIRGTLLDLWHAARETETDPVAAWASIVEDPPKRKAFHQVRGRGGFRRASWDEALEMVAASMLYTAKRYGPDRVIGFSPIPAMSMISYAAGSRLLQLFGAPILSFYDWYADFPPASPEVWGEKTDVSESADWFNSKYIVTMGSNLNMTRTPDVHFAVEARYHGAKLVVLSPDFSQVSKYADWWIPINAGMDGAFWMAVSHVILQEWYVNQQVDAFIDYLLRFTDAPFLVELTPSDDGCLPGRFLRAQSVERYKREEHAGWKFLVLDRESNDLRMPQGSVGFRWQGQEGQWNLEMKDGADGSHIAPVLSLIDCCDTTLGVRFIDFATSAVHIRHVPVRHIETVRGEKTIATTVFDMLMARFGIKRGLGGDYPDTYNHMDGYTPAWQEPFTGVGRETVIRFAREWASTAQTTGGRCTVIPGSGANHWYHANLNYRAAITALILCGCVGVNGGGLNHYTGQEKVGPETSWNMLAMALDWGTTPRLQNAPSFHYVHTDQWRYEKTYPDHHPAFGPFDAPHAIDLQVDAVRRGWMPFYPQFDRSPIAVVEEAEKAGVREPEAIAEWAAQQIKEGRLKFAVEDPDAPENWPRVWLIWRGNALLASAKGHEYFLRHYLGVRGTAIGDDKAARGVPRRVAWREPAPEGKLDLVVDINFRMDTSALYSDIILPAASWYEKCDINTTDLHSYIHPMGEAVPPCWEARPDWDIFRELARTLSRLAPLAFAGPFRELVSRPLVHDTPDEIAQGEVVDWATDQTPAIPGRTMPHLNVVERDYATLFERFASFGRMAHDKGMEGHGLRWSVKDLYEEKLKEGPCRRWNGVSYPSLERAEDAIDAILRFAPETNGEIAYRGFEVLEKKTGVRLCDLAESSRSIRRSYSDLADQPRRLLTSPYWSGITNDGRAYASYAINRERLVPWRTLTGRQHFYIDHEAYLAFGEFLPACKLKLGLVESGNLAESTPDEGVLRLSCITPHGKWHIHTTYYDDLRMLTLSRGIEPFWLNDSDAESIGVADNDWVEVYNDNGVVVTRSVVSARIPSGLCIFYHAPERTISVPISPKRNYRAGSTNSMTRIRLKPMLLAGAYGQICYVFNAWGPPASDRDTYVFIRKLPGAPVME